MSTKMTILKKLYSTEPGTKYYVEILDNKGNVILENNIEAVIGGEPTDVIFQKIDFNKKLTINVYNYYEQKSIHFYKTILLGKCAHLDHMNIY